MTFSVNKPVSTTGPTVVVDGGLAVGTHVFRLVVINRDGRASQPADVIVTVERSGLVIPRAARPGGSRRRANRSE
jgi:hypothetical protein